MADNKYLRGKIYKLVNEVDKEIYVGSTTQPLHKRYYEHKSAAINKKTQHFKVYQHFNNLGWDNVKIILVEAYPCQDRMELLRKEREHIDILKPSLNINLPTRTIYDWNKDNPNYHREYYQQHKEESIVPKKKQWYEQNKEAIIEKTRKYRSQNIETLNNKQKEYNQRNKDYIKQYKSTKIICPHCQKEITRHCLSKHIKRKHTHIS
jgi:predicted GIY-YIG superfamily endonuclease